MLPSLPSQSPCQPAPLYKRKRGPVDRACTEEYGKHDAFCLGRAFFYIPYSQNPAVYGRIVAGAKCPRFLLCFILLISRTVEPFTSKNDNRKTAARRGARLPFRRIFVDDKNTVCLPRQDSGVKVLEGNYCDKLRQIGAIGLAGYYGFTTIEEA